ncbi:hypothetical protein ACWFPY_35060 [Nocardia fluminea]
MAIRADIDGEAAVAELWPVDGPYDPQHFAEAMLALQHLVRYSNHATLEAPSSVLPEPHDAATVIRRLSDGIGGLGQLLDQLADRCDALAQDPTLRSATGAREPDPCRAATAASAELRTAGSGVDVLRTTVQRAASAMNNLYRDDENGDDQ